MTNKLRATQRDSEFRVSRQPSVHVFDLQVISGTPSQYVQSTQSKPERSEPGPNSDSPGGGLADNSN